jgi:hypothetical protein
LSIRGEVPGFDPQHCKNKQKWSLEEIILKGFRDLVAPWWHDRGHLGVFRDGPGCVDHFNDQIGIKMPNEVLIKKINIVHQEQRATTLKILSQPLHPHSSSPTPRKPCTEIPKMAKVKSPYRMGSSPAEPRR